MYELHCFEVLVLDHIVATFVAVVDVAVLLLFLLLLLL